MIEDPKGEVVARLSEFLGRQTNNYAEYKGLLAVLEWALEHGVRRLARGFRFRADGEADEGPVQGEEPGAAAVWEEAQRLALKLEGFEMRHTLRGGTKKRIGWRMQAMDRRQGASRRVSGVAEGPSVTAGTRREAQ